MMSRPSTRPSPRPSPRPSRVSSTGASAAEKYIQEHRIAQLFQSLTVGLLHHRPNDPVQFISDALDNVPAGGWDNAFWDTFLPNNGVHRQRSLPQLQGNLDVAKEVGHEGVKEDVKEVVQDDVKDDDIGVVHHEDVDVLVNENRNQKGTKAPGSKRPKFSRHEAVVEPQTSVGDAGGGEGGMGDADDAAAFIQQQSESSHQVAFSSPQVAAVMTGSIDDLPPLPTNTVRIFLSSTFSDFKAERNILPEKAFPALQEFCQESGLDFQVVDMRWGVTDEMMNDHQVSALCLQEIKMCRQVSCGPNFVTLLGNRYGYRPFPATILATEFAILHAIAKEAFADQHDLLTDWFRLDENACPAEYVLQPILSRLPNYNNMADQSLRQRDLDTWNGIHDTLRGMLRTCAKMSVERGQLTQGADMKYTISVTEEEVAEGLLCAADAQDKALCYVRDLEGLERADVSSKSSRFMDTQQDVVDADALDLLSKLKAQKIPPKLEDGIYQRYTVPWKGELLEKSADDTLMSYLDRFCDDFVTDMKSLVTKYIQQKETLDDESLYLEVLHHAKFGHKKIEVFCGREDVIEKIQAAVMEERTENIPLIVYGQSGFGKTSLMAKIASLIQSWKKPDTIVVQRYLGTSPQSSDIILVLRSLIKQICALFGYTSPPDDQLQKMGKVRHYLQHVFTMVSERYSSRQVVIILDSIDQLSPANGAHDMVWLPAKLPPNIHLIISMIPDQFNCLRNTKKRVFSPGQFIELEPLTGDAGETIVDTYLSMNGRTITKQQKQHVLNAFMKQRQPLYLKLVMDTAKRWSSYTEIDASQVVASVQEGINTLFGEIEVRYGKVFVEHALSYLTCGKGGMSGIEMEDVLSCDDEVLNEVYKYHDPPLDGVIRIPSLMWSRLQYDLKDYVAERQVDGKTVMTWYHRQFWEVAEKRYLSNEDECSKYHSALSELFSQTNGIKRTIILEQRNGKTMNNADRKVAPQKLNVTNLRKLNTLPFHLFHSKQINELKSQCMINFKFLLTKLRAVGVNTVLNEFVEYSRHSLVSAEKDIMIVIEFLEMAYAALNFDPQLFALNIRGILCVYSEPYPVIGSLCQDAQHWLDTTDDPMLLPVSPLNFTPLESPLKFKLLVGYSGCISKDENLMVCNWLEIIATKSKLQVFDLETKDLLVSLNVKKNSALAITTDSENFFYAEEDSIKMIQARTGDFSRSWLLDDSFEKMSVRQMAVDKDGKYLAVAAKCEKPKDADPKRWRMSTKVFLIDLEQPDIAEPISSASYFAKKHVDRVLFLEDGKTVVTMAKERISMYSVSDMVETQMHKDSGMHSTYACFDEELSVIVLPHDLKLGAKFSVYNYKTKKASSGPIVHTGIEGEENIESFGLATQENLQQILLGTKTLGNKFQNSYLWLWSTADWKEEDWSEYDTIQLAPKQWKTPTCFICLKDWSYCFVGWSTGEISVVDLNQKQEIYFASAHQKQVNMIHFYKDFEQMVTLADDHSLMTWDVEKFVQVGVKEHGKEVVTQEKNTGIPVLDLNEQVLGMECIEDHVITAGFLNIEGPKFWHTQNAHLDKEKTDAYGENYRESANSLEVEFNKRYHASLNTVDDGLLYCRKRRNAIGCFTFRFTGHQCLAANWFNDAYFLLPFHDSIKCTDDSTRVLIMRDGELLCLSFPELTTVHSIEIPKISEDIPNIASSGGKRKLLFCKLCVTTDGKYAIFVNPSMTTFGETKEKYFYLIDLSKGEFVQRCLLPKFVPWKFMEDTFSYLVLHEDHAPGIFSPAMVPTAREDEKSYMCLTYSGHSILSHDLTLGVELIAGYGIRVWNTVHRERLLKLQGHIAEINCGAFSTDNRFLATGSFDCTTRLWNLETGQQMCLFHSMGSIDGVLFSPSVKELVIHHYSAPRRKKASIMKMKNL